MQIASSACSLSCCGYCWSLSSDWTHIYKGEIKVTVKKALLYGDPRCFALSNLVPSAAPPSCGGSQQMVVALPAPRYPRRRQGPSEWSTGARLSGCRTQLCYLLVWCLWGPYFLFWVSISPKTELASFPHRDIWGLSAQIHAKGLGSIWCVQKAQ